METYGNVIKFVGKWTFHCLVVGLLVGSASAFFLVSLDAVTTYRTAHPWLLWGLPLAGFGIGWLYLRFGQEVVKGNNQLIEELQQASGVISWKMMPFILLTTLVTHLFGGSAGREGTAVQMGGSLAEQWNIFSQKFFPSTAVEQALFDRKLLLIAGMSAGFASVFGTPLAGMVFALEVAIIGKMRYEALFPSLLAALLADGVCQQLWGVGHTHYVIGPIPVLSLPNLLWAMLAGSCFGLMGMGFAQLTHLIGVLSKKYIAYAPLRPLLGGLVVCLLTALLGYRYIGLGVPVIVESFQTPVAWYDSLGKTFFTALTLGTGFKGGEVTPLFYIGATLGNTLATVLPLPLPLLAGMGFVGVFAGASNTPLACTLMGIELFGVEAGLYLAVACMVAYVFSGHIGIYASQQLGVAKVYAKKRRIK